MENLKPQELIGQVAGLALSGLRFAVHQLKGGAWGDLGEKYGEPVGGHNVHPASIQFYTTGEPEKKAA